MKPKIFIGSSVEGLNVAYAIQQNLTHDAESTVWDQGVFELSKTTIESLNDILDKIDFAIFVFNPDDVVTIRDNQSLSVRDNVIFELGLFIGKLGRERVFYITPDGNDLHIPTDLVGVTPGKYDPNRDDNSLQAATGSACNQARIQIKKLGPLKTASDDIGADISVDNKNKDTDWIIDLVDNKYEIAKDKLEKLKETKTGDELLKNEAWLAYTNFKLNEKSGLQELCDLAEKYNDNLEIQLLIPKMLLWEDYIDLATEITNKALVNLPSESKIIAIHAQCHKDNNDIEQAINILNAAFPSKNPDIALALIDIYEDKEEHDSSINVIHSAYLEYPSNESLMYKYARLLDDKSKHQEALYLLNTLTINHPKNVTYWGYLSNCCLSLDLYDKAMIASRKAETLSEDKDAWILHNIGNMLNNKDFYTEAIEYLNKGLKVEPESQYAHDRLSGAIKNKEKEDKEYQKLCKEGKILLRNYSNEHTNIDEK